MSNFLYFSPCAGFFMVCTFLYVQVASVSATPNQATPQMLVGLAPKLSPQVAELALNAARCAGENLGEGRSEKLAIIDYSRPSVEKRFWLFDTSKHKLLVEDLVAHGRNSGENQAVSFSNTPGSLKSSLGLFKVGSTYIGKHGDSLRLIGLERGINEMALERAIVLHGADYVNQDFIRQHNRIGRSFGCPALSRESALKVINIFRNESGFLFSYYPDPKWLRTSKMLKNCTGT